LGTGCRYKPAAFDWLMASAARVASCASVGPDADVAAAGLPGPGVATRFAGDQPRFTAGEDGVDRAGPVEGVALP
jgi:hypothetical protein